MRNSPHKTLKPAVLALSLLISGAVLADSTSDSLTRIEAETLVLKAREKQLVVQAQIVTKQAEIAAKRAENYRLARIATAGDPVIRAIEGMGGILYATLQMDNGSIVEAKVGDVLPNGMKVTAINPNEVIAETRKKKRIRLSTGVTAAPSYSPSGSITSMALPPLPSPSSYGIAR